MRAALPAAFIPFHGLIYSGADHPYATQNYENREAIHDKTAFSNAPDEGRDPYHLAVAVGYRPQVCQTNSPRSHVRALDR